jgi:hypothetical protein
VPDKISILIAPAWRTAIETLLVGENGGPPDFARIGMMQTLYPTAEREHDLERRRPAWRRGIYQRRRWPE